MNWGREMADDRKRLLVMLSLLGGLVLAGAVFFVLMSGGGSESPSAVQQPVPVATADEDLAPAPTRVKSRRAAPLPAAGARDPFDPLVKPEPSKAPSQSTKPKPTSKPKSTSSDTKTKKDTKPADKSKPAPKTTDKPKAPEKVDDTPELIGGGGDDATVAVKLVAVLDDFLKVNVDGERSRLFLGVPGDSGLTYVSDLGGGCAWVGRQGADERVAICEGDTASL